MPVCIRLASNLVAPLSYMPISKRTKQAIKSPNGQFEEDVEIPASSEISYEEGSPRKHHFLYFPSGDIVIQVEMAIFKVHTFFLAQHSKVLSDMLTLTKSEEREGDVDGTDETPLVLQDKAKGWELFLNSFYRHEPLLPFAYSGQDMLDVLEIAHKYCMESFEERILAQLQEATTTQGYVELLAASKIVSSYSMYQKAVEGLVKVSPKPDLEQAKVIGVEAYFEVVSRSGLR